MHTVLIVDDSRVISDSLKEFFENEIELDFEIAGIGEDGNEAVQLYKEKKPDLVTLDITMPNKDGIQALKEILLINPDARVLMISALEETERVNQALELGAYGYIRKPLDLADQSFVDMITDEVADALEGIQKGSWNYM